MLYLLRGDFAEFINLVLIAFIMLSPVFGDGKFHPFRQGSEDFHFSIVFIFNCNMKCFCRKRAGRF